MANILHCMRYKRVTAIISASSAILQCKRNTRSSPSPAFLSACAVRLSIRPFSRRCSSRVHIFISAKRIHHIYLYSGEPPRRFRSASPAGRFPRIFLYERTPSHQYDVYDVTLVNSYNINY